MFKTMLIMLVTTCALVPVPSFGAPEASGSTASDSGSGPQQWRFRVSLGDKEIGEQVFKLDRRGERSTVSIAADFDVRYVALSFYNYKHRNTETWRGNCLESIDATTDDNGKQLAVQGSRASDGFRVKASKGQRLLPECIMSFAYWNPDFLRQGRLLNSQTGDFENVTITRLGPERIQVRKRPVEATRYKLKGDGIDIDLWYAGDRDWVRLESEVNRSRLTFELI